jgi:hypothetical protein
MSRDSESRIEHRIGATGSLTLRGVSGDVKLTGTDGEEVSIVAHLQHGARLNVQKSDGGLLVEQVQRGMLLGGMFERESVDFEVELPRRARLDVKTVSGDVQGRDLLGDQAVRTVSGDLSLGKVAGRVEVTAVSGDVEIKGSGSLELTATTTSGDVNVEADALARLTARSVSGDVSIRGRLEPGPRHSVETVSGDLRLDSAGGVSVEIARAVDLGRGESGPIVVGDGAARLLFRTLSGDHEVKGGQLRADALDGSALRDIDEDTTVGAPAASEDSIDVLRALERGEIDIDEATRRLETARNG